MLHGLLILLQGRQKQLHLGNDSVLVDGERESDAGAEGHSGGKNHGPPWQVGQRVKRLEVVLGNVDDRVESAVRG